MRCRRRRILRVQTSKETVKGDYWMTILSSLFFLERSQRKLISAFWTFNLVTLHKRRTTRTSNSSTIRNVERKATLGTFHNSSRLCHFNHFYTSLKRFLHILKYLSKTTENKSKSIVKSTTNIENLKQC